MLPPKEMSNSLYFLLQVMTIAVYWGWVIRYQAAEWKYRKAYPEEGHGRRGLRYR
jgi:hypothetical protein